jgi:hypothetical protein
MSIFPLVRSDQSAAGTASCGTIDCEGMKYFCADFNVIRIGSWNLASSSSKAQGKGFNINGFIGRLILFTKPVI